MSMLSFKVDGLDAVIGNLAQIKSPTLRKRILDRAGKQLIRAAKDRVAAQTDLDGKPFGDYSTNTNHTRPRKRSRRMLARIVKRLAVMEFSDFGVTVGWRNSTEGNIAAKQQFGFRQVFKKAWQRVELDGSRKEKDYYQLPATRRQAKALIEAGYKVRRQGDKGAWKTPTIKWITQNLTIARAGLILRVLRGSKDQWETNLPPRAFLGVTDADLQLLADAVGAELQKAFAGAAA